MAKDNHTEPNCPLVKFRAPNRSFKRVFKNRSLSETIELVRDKLRLRDETITLAYLEDDTKVDLEDDSDFEAFRAIARPNTTLNVLVTIGDPSQPADRVQYHRQQSENTARPKRKRKHRSADLSDAEEDERRTAEPAEVLHRHHTASPPTEPPAEPPKKKRRKEKKKDSKHAKSSEPVSQLSELADATPPLSEPPADSAVARPSTTKPKRRHKDILQPSSTEPAPHKSSQDKLALRASDSEDDGEPTQTAEPVKLRKRKRTLSRNSDASSREAVVFEEDEPATGSAPAAGPPSSPSLPADWRSDKSGPSAPPPEEIAKQKKKKQHAVLDAEEDSRNTPTAAQPAPPEESATGPPVKKNPKKHVSITLSPVQNEDEDEMPETSGNIREEPVKQRKAQTRRRVRTEESSTATARDDTQSEKNTESDEEVSSETEAASTSIFTAAEEEQQSASSPAVPSATQPASAAKADKPAKAKKTKALAAQEEQQSEPEPKPAPAPAAPVAAPEGKSNKPAKKMKKQVAQQQQGADVEAASPAPMSTVTEPSNRPARVKKVRAGQEGPKDDGAQRDVEVVEQAVANEEASAPNKPAKKATRKKKAVEKQPETDPDPATAPTSTPAADPVSSPQDEPAAKQTKAKKSCKVVFETSTAPVATASISSPDVSHLEGSAAQSSSNVSEPRPTAEAASASQEAVKKQLPASKTKGRKGKKNTSSTKFAEEKAARSMSDDDNMWADILFTAKQRRASEALLNELGSSSPAGSASGTGPLPAKKLFAVEIVRTKASSQPADKVAGD